MSEKQKFANEIHHRVLRKFKKRKVIIMRQDETWAIDLADMNTFVTHNNGYKYILCIIDVFSKFAWCVPLKNKTGETILTELLKVIKDSGREPEKIWVDKGSEFYNKNFKAWAKSKNIVIYSTYGESKSVVVERFIRTLKDMFNPIFTLKNTRDWVSILPEVLKKYNNSEHSSIGMTPTEASDPANAVEALTNLMHVPNEKKKPKKEKPPKFDVGDDVRISRQKDIFEKGGYNFTYEVFQVEKVLDTDPVTYQLIDEMGDKIEGSFYEQELLKTEVPEYYEIEKILDERKVGKKKEFFVKFLGWNKKFNAWLPENQLYDVPTK